MASVTITFTDSDDEFDPWFHYNPSETNDNEEFSMAVLMAESVKYLVERGIVEDFIPAAIENLESACECCS